jgi:oligopeptidase B
MDHLIRRGYTRRGCVALEGSSAGGMLAAALLNRRPDCIAAAVLRSPFVDVLTTMLDCSLPLTVHEHAEFGDPLTDKDVFRSLQRVCPYASMPAAAYPPVLVTSAWDDARVPVWGPAKYVARLRTKQLGSAKAFLLCDDQGGHFGDETHAVEDAARDYAFLLHAMEGGWR